VVLGAVIGLLTVFMVVRHVLHQREWSEWHGDPTDSGDVSASSTP
jgi:hypothetical protein